MIRKGFIFYLLATLFMASLLGSYIIGDAIASIMDLVGWVYFFFSCICHAAIVLFCVWLVTFLPWVLLRLHKLAATLTIIAVSLLSMVVLLNRQVYQIYRFHINGMVWSMATGEGATDIFVFSPQLYLKEAMLLLLPVAVCLALWYLAHKYAHLFSRTFVIGLVSLFLSSILLANGLHAYGAFVQKTSILQSTRLVPYYFPLTVTRWLIKRGVVPPVPRVEMDVRESGILSYPCEPLTVEAVDHYPNIILLLIDSWNRRSLTPETMPHVYRFAQENEWFTDHLSSCNDTRYSVFSIFTGIQPYYYPAFEASHTSPLLVNQLIECGYDFRVYPSSNILNPPFNRILFQRISNLRVETPGDNAFQRDQRIAHDFINDLPALKAVSKPFFAFLFFDLPHSFDLPKDSVNRFLPSWEYADYARLNNDLDPTPFWNLYRHTCYQTDLLIKEVLEQLDKQDLMNNTIILLTGDHSQEFNENHKNYWGHASNFSTAQIGVPFILRTPQSKPVQHHYRTTHYDIAPTLMHDYLGVTNPTGEYSAGHLLSDPCSRNWHFVGNEIRNAFILVGDTIIMKEGNGWMEVTDSHLNPVEHYRVNPQMLNDAFHDLNRFYK